MTRSAPALSILIIAFAAIAFALPAYAYDGHNHDDDHWDDRVRTPSCEITASPNTVYYGGRVTLSWDSNDADYADITDIGRVGTDGSHTIYAYASKTYYMTVYNDGRTSECETFINILGDQYRGGYPYYNYPYTSVQYPYTYPATYVSLTQIPYTGFDFGPVGNAMYWTTLAAAAIVGAYLLVYMSGAQALATIPVVNDTIRASRLQYAAVRGFFLRPAKTAAPTQIVHATAPEQALTSTRMGNDTMQMIEGETPRIVITRN